jgi:hypothetical protein
MARKAIDRALRALDEQRTELLAARRELGESEDEEPTQPGDRRASQQMQAVTRATQAVDKALSEGKR